MHRIRKPLLQARVTVGSTSQSQRSGAAAVELAITLPILVVLIFGSIEASNAIFLKQAATVAAYETARIASTVGGTETEAQLRGQEILTARNINDGTITIAPAISASTRSGQEITVTVSVPSTANSIGPQFYYRNTTLRSVFRMNRL